MAKPPATFSDLLGRPAAGEERTGGGLTFQDILSGRLPGLDIEDLIRRTARRYGVPEQLALAVARAESGLRQEARSPAGAIGVMQLMPATAMALGVDPHNLAQNIEGGIRYLRQQFDRFGDWRLAVAAYNAGPEAVKRYGGIPPFRETQKYVQRVFSQVQGRLQPAPERFEAPRTAAVLPKPPQPRTFADVVREAPKHLLIGATFGVAPLRTELEQAAREGRQVVPWAPFRVGGVTASAEHLLGAGLQLVGGLAGVKFLQTPAVAALSRLPAGAAVLREVSRLPFRHFLGSISLGALSGITRAVVDLAGPVREGKISPSEAARRVAEEAGLGAAGYGVAHVGLTALFHGIRAGRIGIERLVRLRRNLEKAVEDVTQAAPAPEPVPPGGGPPPVEAPVQPQPPQAPPSGPQAPKPTPGKKGGRKKAAPAPAPAPAPQPEQPTPPPPAGPAAAAPGPGAQPTQAQPAVTPALPAAGRRVRPQEPVQPTAPTVGPGAAPPAAPRAVPEAPPAPPKPMEAPAPTAPAAVQVAEKLAPRPAESIVNRRILSELAPDRPPQQAVASFRQAVARQLYPRSTLEQLATRSDPATSQLVDAALYAGPRLARFAGTPVDIRPQVARAVELRANPRSISPPSPAGATDDPVVREILRISEQMPDELGAVFYAYTERASRATGGESPVALLRQAVVDVKALQQALAQGQPVAAAGKRATTITVADIVERLQKAYDVPIRLGRVGLPPRMYLPKRMLGLYRPDVQVIRRRIFGDLSTTYHEIGHHLDNLLKLSDDQSLWGELENLMVQAGAVDPSAYKGIARAKEGIAEFFRLLHVDPQRARQLAPRFWDVFWGKVSANNNLARAIEQSISDFQDLMRLADGDPLAYLRSFIAETKPERLTWRRVKEELWDPHEVLKVMQKELGIPLREGLDPFTEARLATGWAGLAKLALGEDKRGVRGIFSVTGEKVGKSLDEVLEPVADELEDFVSYLIARRTKELGARGITAFYPDANSPEARAFAEAVEKALAIGASKGWDKVADDLVMFQNTIVNEFLVKTGLMSADLAMQIFAKNMAYVPFYRWFEDLGGLPMAVSPSLRQPVRSILGSTRPIIDPLVSIVGNVKAYAQLAAKQRLLTSLYRVAQDKTLQEQGAAKWVEIIPSPARQYRVNAMEAMQKLRDLLEDSGIKIDMTDDVKKALAGQSLVFFAPKAFPGGKEIKSLEIPVMVKGQPRWMRVHPDLYRLLQLNPDPSQMGLLVKLIAKISRFSAAQFVTWVNFALSNLQRDQITAAIQSRYGYKMLLDFVRGLFSYLKRDQYYAMWLRSGGYGGTLAQQFRSAMRQDLYRLFRSKANTPGELLLSTLDKVSLANLSELLEGATRLGAFKRAIETELKMHGLPAELTSLQKLRTVQAQRILNRSALEAKDVTVDFTVRPRSIALFDAMHAFFNANVQGLRRMIEAMGEDPAGTLGRAVMYVTFPELVLWAVNKDNPEYQELPSWKKNLFWHIPYPTLDGKTKLLSIPKPFIWGQLFGTLPRLAVEWLAEQDPSVHQELREVATSFWGDYADRGVPAPIMPLLEIWANYSFFRSQPIVPRAEEDLPPSEQYGPYQTEIAKALGRLLNLSPRQIEYLVRSYTGQKGLTAMRAADYLFGARGPAMGAPLIEQIPGIQIFATRPFSEPQSVSLLYEELRRLEAAHRAESRRYGAPPVISQRLAELRDAQSRIRDLIALRNRVMMDPSLSPAEKYRRAIELNALAAQEARMALGRRPPIPLEEVLR